MPPVSSRSVRRRPALDRITLTVLVIFILLAGATACLAYQLARNLFASWNLPGFQGISTNVPPQKSNGRVLPTPPVNALSGDKNAPSGALDPQEAVTPLPWDGSSRFTILIMGLDYRDWSAGSDIPRTDSMLLLSIDPQTQTAGMLSIPRDLWVTIPGMEGNYKINTAYRSGEMYKMPDGPTLAMKTVENVIGVPVQYYALVDFTSFVRFIDLLGGLDIHIYEKITIDPIGPGNTITLQPGVQTLTGQEALAYARERYQGDGDFSRSQRQQEVIMAMRKQILTLNMLPILIAKAPAIYDELKSGIRTNLTLDQVIKIAWMASQIKEQNIKRGVFNPHTDVKLATLDTPDGVQDVLIPNPDQIRQLRDEIFSADVTANPPAVAVAVDPIRQMKDEKASVIVLNGTGLTGMAKKAGDFLRTQNVNVVGEETADRIYHQTTIIDYNGKPHTINYILQQLKLIDAGIPIINRSDPSSKVDIEVIIGQDWANQ